MTGVGRLRPVSKGCASLIITSAVIMSVQHAQLVLMANVLPRAAGDACKRTSNFRARARDGAPPGFLRDALGFAKQLDQP